jgi:hypothetical protein
MVGDAAVALRKMDEDGLRKLNSGLQGLMSELDLSDGTYGLQPLPLRCNKTEQIQQ